MWHEAIKWGGWLSLPLLLYNSKLLRKRTETWSKYDIRVSLKSCQLSFSSGTFPSQTKGHLVLHYTLNPVSPCVFQDRPFFYSNLHSCNYSVLVKIWCQPLLGDLCPLCSEQKCVSWLTTGWGARLQRRHLVRSNRGDSLLGSLWKLTAKHSQLDLRYLERLGFSPWIKGGPHKTQTLSEKINASLVACQHASPPKIRTIKHIACKLWRWLKLHVCEHM